MARRPLPSLRGRSAASAARPGRTVDHLRRAVAGDVGHQRPGEGRFRRHEPAVTDATGPPRRPTSPDPVVRRDAAGHLAAEGGARREERPWTYRRRRRPPRLRPRPRPQRAPVELDGRHRRPPRRVPRPGRRRSRARARPRPGCRARPAAAASSSAVTSGRPCSASTAIGRPPVGCGAVARCRCACPGGRVVGSAAGTRPRDRRPGAHPAVRAPCTARATWASSGPSSTRPARLCVSGRVSPTRSGLPAWPHGPGPRAAAVTRRIRRGRRRRRGPRAPPCTARRGVRPPTPRPGSATSTS